MCFYSYTVASVATPLRSSPWNVPLYVHTPHKDSLVLEIAYMNGYYPARRNFTQASTHPYICHGTKSFNSDDRVNAPWTWPAASTWSHSQFYQSTVSKSLGLRDATNLFGCQYTVRLDTTLFRILHSQISRMVGLYV